MAKAQKVTSDYTSIDDLSLPRGASLAALREQHVGLERSNSDSNLNLISPQSWSSLSVDKTFFWLRGRGNDQSARVQVEWDIQDNVGAQDWIGLFQSGEQDTSKFLDCKTRGSSGGATGTIFWDLDAVEHLFTEDKTVVCFKYISGTSGEVLATSPQISVILAKNVHATNLKKGVFFNPDPYIKLQILPHNQKNQVQPHHHRELRSSVKTNSANPKWKNERSNDGTIPNDSKVKDAVSDLIGAAVKHFLNTRISPAVSTDTLVPLIELVLTLNSFEFWGEFFYQISGVAMGTKMGPSNACLFMGYLEWQMVNRYQGPTPEFFYRYIDDSIGVSTMPLARCCASASLVSSLAGRIDLVTP
ncbi:E3 ubiquitin-protein ligase HECW2 [Elysia marginata]|uniref:E3 ubiquitin-protein ligase HECW2 n=1 Tax=Elysia marginata TaxID=1093978 RepID=A0AAV4H2K1_9GAST|nr:E3 ubiquitin-protein ligase HECW2 [Elysia marginata]